MHELVQGVASVADRIRALDRAGFKRSEIARFLGKRYQHVRNVLVADEQIGLKPPPRAAGRAGQDTGRDRVASSVRVKVGSCGEVELPAAMRQALSLKDGDVLFARLEGGEIHLLTPRAAMLRAQALVRQFVPGGVSLVDELLEDRRREVEQEWQDG
jgi:hypothetical protein